MGSLALAMFATACGSGGGSSSGPAQLGVRDEYEARGDLPASGGITAWYAARLSPMPCAR